MNEAGYEYCTAFFAGLAAEGVQQVVVSPGSRSTPLTLSAAAVSGLTLTIHHDERAAAFFALGAAKTNGVPVALVCTSGTAAANYLPAVVEAFHAAVPLIVLTADRPPELRYRGAPQTIDQIGIYGTHVRWAVELPVPDEVQPGHARTTAQRAVRTALGPPSGPVHLNWPLRKPLEPSTPLPAVAATAGALPRDPEPVSASQVEQLAELTRHERGLIVAGPVSLTATERADIAAFSRCAGWPVLADATSQLRAGAHVEDAPIISTAPHLLGCEPVTSAPPEVILQIGAVPSSAAYDRWLPSTGADAVILIDPNRQWRDPSAAATDQTAADPAALLGAVARQVGGERDSEWRGRWSRADELASQTIDAALGTQPLSEASLARMLGAELPSEALLYVSNSMPVRDVDLFLGPRAEPLTVLANRGANGIDGVTSSALGAASTHPGPVTLLTGDIALIHDAAGLLVGASLGTDLTIVVPNNDGGGIFSFLPIADTLGADEFETLFHTPHGLDLGLLSKAAGAEHQTVRTAPDFAAALATAPRTSGLSVIEVPVDTAAAVAQRRAIEELVHKTILERLA